MKTHHFLLALLALFLPLAQSCTNDDLTAPNQSKELTFTLSLTSKDVTSFAQSRADWSDKYPAVFNEDNITSAILVVYNQSIANFASLTGDALTAAQTQKPVYIYDLNVGNGEIVDGKKVYTTGAFKMELNPGDTYYYLVIANPPSGMTASTFSGMNISQIADYTVTRTQLYTSGDDVQHYDNFLMTSDVERSFSPTAAQLASTESIDITNGSPVLVERLACRIDLAFGNPEFDDDDNAIATAPIYYDADGNPIKFYEDANGYGYPEEGKTIAKIVLPVYNYAEYIKTGNLVPTHDTYTITSVDLIDIRKDKEYLIQRTSSSGKNNYFAFENWRTLSFTDENNVTYNAIYPNKTTVNPPKDGNNSFDNLSFTLSGFIKKNNSLYTSTLNGTYFYTLGYFLENTNKYSNFTTNKTKLKIFGKYHKVGDLASPGDKEFNDMNLEFLIRHCDPNGRKVVTNDDRVALPYGTGRNCIYRLYMDKVFSDGDRVYVTWYYDSANDGAYDPVKGVDGAAIVRDIDESPGSDITVND